MSCKYSYFHKFIILKVNIDTSNGKMFAFFSTKFDFHNKTTYSIHNC